MTTWMTRAEAAAHLRITPGTLDRWVKAGKVTRYRGPGGSIRFRREELDALLTPEDPEPELVAA
jgi:excisionase family DNA binding protein